MIRRILFANFPLKVAALFLAVVLWLFVVSKGQTEVSLNIPIEYTNIPQGLEIVKREVKTATLLIRSHESLSRNISPETVKIHVDVSKAKKGEGTFTIKKGDVKVPYGASILKIEPSTAWVVFEETVSKKTPVVPDVIGSPENGYYVGSVEVTPKEVVIEGAKSEVRKMRFIQTEPIDVTGLTGDYTQEVGLRFSEAKVRVKTDKVEVQIGIARRGK